VNTKEENGDSALHLAIDAGYTEIAEMIIDRGAKIDPVGHVRKRLYFTPVAHLYDCLIRCY
jgi:ankyrin repeat protein